MNEFEREFQRFQTEFEQETEEGPPVGECPICSHTDMLYNIRGQIACLHCHLDRIWDYMEGTRRMMEGKE